MTAITHDTAAGWGFTIGTQPYTGYASRDAAAEALYDLEHGQLLCAAPTTAETDEDTPIATIHGCPVYGTRYDEPGEECHGQLYNWSLEWKGKTISVSDDSDALNIWPIEQVECRGDIHMDDWQWLRALALAQTDVVEQLIALARGQGEPPAPVLPAVHKEADAPPAPNMRARIEAIWTADEMPSGSQIYDLLLEDRIARYVWWRCVDWVLYRLRNGMPVQRMNDEDTVPAAIDARFKAAQHAYRLGGPRPEPFDVREMGNGNTIDRWERTPEQAAALDAEYERLLRLLDQRQRRPA